MTSNMLMVCEGMDSSGELFCHPALCIVYGLHPLIAAPSTQAGIVVATEAAAAPTSLVIVTMMDLALLKCQLTQSHRKTVKCNVIMLQCFD